jgi:hypothetical protein
MTPAPSEEETSEPAPAPTPAPAPSTNQSEERQPPEPEPEPDLGPSPGPDLPALPPTLETLSAPVEVPLPSAPIIDLAAGSDCCCLLLHVAHSGMPPLLRKLLESPSIIKAGVNINGDAHKLRADFGVSMCGMCMCVFVGEEEERFYSPFGGNGAYWT